MLYRLVMTGRANIDMRPGALSGAFGDILCCCMDRSIRQSLTGNGDVAVNRYRLFAWRPDRNERAAGQRAHTGLGIDR